MPMFTSRNHAVNGGLGSGRVGVTRNRSGIFAGILYLSGALALALFYQFWIGQLFSILGITLLAIASFRVLSGREFGDVVAFVGAVLAWRFFVLVEFSQYRYPGYFNAWIMLNGPGSHVYAWLRICAIATLLVVTIHSLLRMTPEGWHLRNRSWPTFAASFVGVTLWYSYAVRPYRIPVYDMHDLPPAVIVLHVEKHGLRFRETSLAIYRNGSFYLAEDDRRWFTYGFPRKVSRGSLAGDSMEALKKLTSLPDQLHLVLFSSYVAPREWIADRWYVLFDPWSGRALNVALSRAPEEVSALLEAAKTAPKETNWNDYRWDVCLGFCYDPTY